MNHQFSSIVRSQGYREMVAIYPNNSCEEEESELEDICVQFVGAELTADFLMDSGLPNKKYRAVSFLFWEGVVEVWDTDNSMPDQQKMVFSGRIETRLTR